MEISTIYRYDLVYQGWIVRASVYAQPASCNYIYKKSLFLLKNVTHAMIPDTLSMLETDVNNGVRFVFFGNSLSSCSTLEALRTRGFVPAVTVTRSNSPLFKHAMEQELFCLSVDDFDFEEITQLTESQCGLFIVAGFEKLPKEILSIPKHGSLNLTLSLLPSYNGDNSERIQILCNNSHTGVTIHGINEHRDHDVIVAQREVLPPMWPLPAQVLQEYLAQHGGRLLAEVIPRWINGEMLAESQPESITEPTRLVSEEFPRTLEPTMPVDEQWRRYCAYDDAEGVHYLLQQNDNERVVHVRNAYHRNGAFVVESVAVDTAEAVPLDQFLQDYGLEKDEKWCALSATKNPQVSSGIDKENSSPLLRLREVIFDRVIVMADETGIFYPNGVQQREGWLFDFRSILLDSEILNVIAELFWERYEAEYPFQVGGQEAAAIPLVCAIGLKGEQKGKPVNGFFIRKERKEYGLQKVIEGTLTQDKIIIVDDLLNTATTKMRQIELLEQAGYRVDAIFSIVQFRKTWYYQPLLSRGIDIVSLFRPADFGLEIGESKNKTHPECIFDAKWKFQSDDPCHAHVVPKSTPVLDSDTVYFGADNGIFWAINQSDGSIKWQFKIWRKAQNKAIFSAPALHKETVYFGAYDGNVYALDTATGKPRWTFWEADWVGSSAALAPDLNTLFIGLEFGLFSRKGGIVALDMKTGAKKWEFPMSGLTHSSPAYSQKRRVVGIGCNNYTFYLFDAKTGELQWTHETGAEIRASAAFAETHGYVLFGSFDGNVYVCDIKTGALQYTFTTESPIYSTPLIDGDFAYITSMDKRVYCLDLRTFTEVWRFETGGKIFTNPVIHNGRVYIGSNDGFLYEFDKHGVCQGFFPAGDRIVNNVTYNQETDMYFLLTHANELYALKRSDNLTTQEERE